MVEFLLMQVYMLFLVGFASVGGQKFPCIPGQCTVRSYFIAAVETTWNYTPLQKDPQIKAKKAIYRQYTDERFSTEVPKELANIIVILN